MSIEDDAASASASTSTSTTGGPTTATAAKRVVRTGRVNCRWLYNQVQASRGMILVDTRAHAAYEDDTIPAAINIPPMPHCRVLDDVLAGMPEDQRFLFSAKRRKLRDVVLFGDALKQSSPRPDDMMAAMEPHERRLGMAAAARAAHHRRRARHEPQGALRRLPDVQVPVPRSSRPAPCSNDLAGCGLERTQSGTHNLNYPERDPRGLSLSRQYVARAVAASHPTPRHHARRERQSRRRKRVCRRRRAVP
ncbi:hypothetical protein PINS_up022901 [Pythium insidiosum]|nr:hypothetical protein PINS_up022901 [Pythium insidiosum]